MVRPKRVTRSPRRSTARRQPLWLVCLVLAVALVAGYLAQRGEGPAAGQATPTATAAGDGVIGVFVEPDDGRGPVLDELAAAKQTIDVMVYLLTDKQVVQALVDAEKRGIQVRVILEQHPYGGFGNPEEVAQTLRRAGAEVRWSSSDFTFTHAKTILVDRTEALVLNLNLTASAFESNREFGVVTDRPSIVEPAQRIFDADWAGEQVSDSGGLVVSPIGSRQAIAGLIRSARRSVDIYAEVVLDDAMVELIAGRAKAGIAVRLVISPDDDPSGQADRAKLAAAGVQIRYVDALYIHAKAIVVDRARAFIGSENLTQTSLDENREIGLITDDAAIVARVLATFEGDFANGDAAVTSMDITRMKASVPDGSTEMVAGRGEGRLAQFENSFAEPLDSARVYVYSVRTGFPGSYCSG